MTTLTLRRFLPHTSARAHLLPILDAYLLREMVWPFVGAFFAYFIFWALNIFVLSAQYIINEHVSIFLALRFVILRVPQAIPMAFPFASLVSSMLAMGRLMADNELNALRTSGIHVLRIAATPLAFGFAMFFVTYAMNEYVAPPSVDLSTRAFYQMIYHSNSLPFETQFFRRDPDTGNTFFVTQVGPDGKTLYGVQIFKPGRDGPWNETLQARTAVIAGSSLVLKDVIDTRFSAQGYVVGQQHVNSVTVALPIQESAANFLSTTNNDPWAMNSKQLALHVRDMQEQGIGGTTLGTMEFTLANKVAWPFACFVAVLLAVPLAIRFGKRGRMLGMALAVVAFFIYFVLTSAASAFGTSGAINTYVAAWLPNIIMGCAGGTLLWLEER
ncbi:MAG: LptF/LptG family permease [Candidatus Tyrphobacter sp.]